MLFIAAATEPTMILMLTEEDVQILRTGRTLFVDQSATGKFQFDKVVLSLHRDNAEVAATLRQAGHKVPAVLPEPEPQAEDARCAGCRGVMKAHLLYRGKCIVCWHEDAQKGAK